MRTFEVKSYGHTYEVFASVEEYANNNTLAIELWDDEGPFATLTVNIAASDKMAGKDRAFVDTNNCPWAEEFIKTNGLGKFAGYIGFSGYCEYPLYQFNLDALSE